MFTLLFLEDLRVWKGFGGEIQESLYIIYFRPFNGVRTSEQVRCDEISLIFDIYLIFPCTWWCMSISTVWFFVGVL